MIGSQASGASRTAVAVGLVVVAAVIVITSFLRQSERQRAPLTDAQISAFLHDDADPDGIVYTIEQLHRRRQQGETLAPWAEEVMRLAGHPNEQVRHAVAHLMAAEPRPEFHRMLLRMLSSETLLVRNAAALSLSAYDDSSGHEQIATMLQPSVVDAPQPGHVQSVVSAGSRVSHGSIIAAVQSGSRAMPVLSPVSGRIRSMSVQDGDLVSAGTRVAVIEPGPEQVAVALQALQKIGKPQDLPFVLALGKGAEMPDDVRQQAKVTEDAIRQRAQ